MSEENRNSKRGDIWIEGEGWTVPDVHKKRIAELEAKYAEAVKKRCHVCDEVAKRANEIKGISEDTVSLFQKIANDALAKQIDMQAKYAELEKELFAFGCANKDCPAFKMLEKGGKR